MDPTPSKQLNNSRALIIRVLLFITLLLPTLLFANLYEEEQLTEEALESNIATTQSLTSIEQLKEIEGNIETLNQRKEKIRRQIALEEDPKVVASLEERLKLLQNQRHDFETLFEKISLGGLDTQRLDPFVDEDIQAYDWKNELIQIIQPLFKEMQRMTDKPRKMERLRSEYLYNQNHIELIDSGLEELANINGQELSEASQERLEALHLHWESVRNDLRSRQEIVQYEMNELQDDAPLYEKIQRTLITFITGRGAILFTAIATSLGIIYTLSIILNYFAKRRERLGRTRRVNVKWRLLVLSYRTLTFLIATIAFLAVLHSMGDMVLFGLAMLILFTLLLSFRTYVPRYLSEFRIFLNLGQVRQGERTLYMGIPWKVERINLYSSYLVNPSLDNGRIRLTMNLMRGLVSRPLEHDELWFPSQVGDSLILPDGTYVEVLRQTPEAVYLDAFTSHIIYPTADFIQAKPKNISKGFYAVVNFGLAYEHFSLPTEVVFEKIKENVTAMLLAPHSDIRDSVNNINVEFRQVNEGISLLYTIIVEMAGSAAPYYYRTPRMIQEACLKTAQQEGWNMPFTQIAYEKSTPSTNLKTAIANDKRG